MPRYYAAISRPCSERRQRDAELKADIGRVHEDNALAESVHGLYKSELIGRRGPWRSLDQLELATAEWVDWYNRRRLHGSLGDIPPAEFEQRYRRRRQAPDAA